MRYSGYGMGIGAAAQDLSTAGFAGPKETCAEAATPNYLG